MKILVDITIALLSLYTKLYHKLWSSYCVSFQAFRKVSNSWYLANGEKKCEHIIIRNQGRSEKKIFLWPKNIPQRRGLWLGARGTIRRWQTGSLPCLFLPLVLSSKKFHTCQNMGWVSEALLWVACWIVRCNISDIHKALLREETIWFKILMRQGENRDPETLCLDQDYTFWSHRTLFPPNDL